MTTGEQVARLLAFLVVLAGPAPLAWAITTRVEREGAGPSRLALLALFSWCLLEMALGLALGAVGALHLHWLLLAEALLLLLGLWLLRGAPRPLRTVTLDGPLLSLVILLLVATGLWLAWRAMIEPIAEVDSIAYHLPTIARWYQTGRLVMLEQFPLFSRYPFGWEILGALAVVSTGSDYLVGLPNVFAWLMFGLAIYCLARELGATRESGLGAGALALTLTGVTRDVTTLHIDLAFAAVFLTACCFGLRFLRTRTRDSLGLLLAAAGMALGIKASALTYLAALAVAGAIRYRRAAPAAGARRGSGLLVMGAGAVLLVGAFWYLRNLVQTGSPLGLVRIGVGGLTLFPGQYELDHFRRTTLLSVFDVGQGEDWVTLFTAVGMHLGVRLWALALLAAPAVPALSWKRTAVVRGRLLGLVALVGSTAFLYLITPYSGDNGTHGWEVTLWVGQGLRYALPCIGLLAVLAAVTATEIGLPRPVMLALGALAAAAALWGGGGAGLVPLGAALLAWMVGRLRRGLPAWRLAAVGATVGLAALIGLAPVAEGKRTAARARVYGFAERIISRERRPDESIGYLLSSPSYWLYGADLRRSVVYLPLTARDAAAWQDLLRRNRVTLVVIGPAGPPAPEEQELVCWLVSEDGPLVPLTPGKPWSKVQLYRVKR